MYVYLCVMFWGFVVLTVVLPQGLREVPERAGVLPPLHEQVEGGVRDAGRRGAKTRKVRILCFNTQASNQVSTGLSTGGAIQRHPLMLRLPSRLVLEVGNSAEVYATHVSS